MKNKDVLLLFNYWSNACSYVSKVLSKLVLSSLVAQQKIRLSSAKNKSDISRPRVHATTPFIKPSSTDFLQSEERTSAQIKNKYGERGSSWRSPLDGTM